MKRRFRFRRRFRRAFVRFRRFRPRFRRFRRFRRSGGRKLSPLLIVAILGVIGYFFRDRIAGIFSKTA